MASSGTRRKVFISYYKADRKEVEKFIKKWAVNEGIFIPRSIGVYDNSDLINSKDTEYVMSQVRKKYLGDSTVTIVLIGKCTHSRRYIDWELKTSLRQGTYTPNGLIGILLPSAGNSGYLPPRLRDNWKKGNKDCYARYYAYPSSATQLRNWIEDAFNARFTRSHLIKNSSDMMKYNRKCQVCGITH